LTAKGANMSMMFKKYRENEWEYDGKYLKKYREDEWELTHYMPIPVIAMSLGIIK